MSNKFTWFPKFTHMLVSLPNDIKVEMLDAVMLYGTDGIEPNFNGDEVKKALFEGFREDIDASVKARTGNKGGRPSKENPSKNGGLESKNPRFEDKNRGLENGNGGFESENPSLYNNTIQNNTIQNNTIQNNTDILSAKADDSSQFVQKRKKVIEYLNNKLGSHFSVNSAKARLVDARLKEGYTVEDCYKVIDNQYLSWANDVKMRAYLRPETLFGTKFDGYLNNTPPALSCCKGYEVAPIVGGAYA